MLLWLSLHQQIRTTVDASTAENKATLQRTALRRHNQQFKHPVDEPLPSEHQLHARTQMWSLVHSIEEQLDSPYIIEVANGKQISVCTVYRNCPLTLNGHTFTIDLIPMELGRFDIIVGIAH
ncbi:hypothetical protein E3N88_23616 [Mikania micrantha]|uniref:Uncharacterized protein n=1 Tax=Mikania micrantha TaxID=192012 RepID=A0A5N6NGB4_9ASTR|nr:hypothetical protein E3N88_23616 [Mikania micrantha]